MVFKTAKSRLVSSSDETQNLRIIDDHISNGIASRRSVFREAGRKWLFQSTPAPLVPAVMRSCCSREWWEAAPPAERVQAAVRPRPSVASAFRARGWLTVDRQWLFRRLAFQRPLFACPGYLKKNVRNKDLLCFFHFHFLLFFSNLLSKIDTIRSFRPQRWLLPECIAVIIGSISLWQGKRFW